MSKERKKTSGVSLATRMSRVPTAAYIFLAAFVLFCLMVPNFATPTNLSNLLTQACILTLLSASTSWMLMMGHADLSAGAAVSLTGMVTAILISSGHNEILAIFAGILVGGVIGLINGFVTIKMKVPAFIGTFGMMGVAQGIANAISGSRSVYLSGEIGDVVTPVFNFLSSPLFSVQFGTRSNTIFSLNMIPVITILMLAVLLLVFYKTRVGGYIYAIGGNVDAAKLSNIDTDRWGMSFFVVNGLVAGVAGMLMVIRLNSAQPTAGSGLEFQAVVAAVLGGNLMSGGKGSVWGAIMGGLVVYVIRNGLSMAGVNANAIMVITGLILILSMLLNLLLDKDADWRKSPLFRNLLGRKV